jgi:hypothetical protein
MNIQFMIEKEEEVYLPFLDIDRYRKLDDSLGHKIYQKSIRTNLYLRWDSHHHPANEQSVLASLIHTAEALCDQDSITQELEFFTIVFMEHGYNPQQI